MHPFSRLALRSGLASGSGCALKMKGRRDGSSGSKDTSNDIPLGRRT